MSDIKIDKFKMAIKQVLKQKKIGYQKLAEYLDCSLPTIKRVLGPDEMTLSRLFRICEFLDVSISDLEVISGNLTATTGKFTPAQQNFLVKNKGHLSYLMSLYSGKSTEEIAKKYNLTKLSEDKYLVALEKLELVKVNAKGIVKTQYEMLPSWGVGPLANAYFEGLIDKSALFYKKRIEQQLKRAEKPDYKDNDIDEGISTFGLQLSVETYRAWAKEQQRQLKDLERISALESKTKNKSELKTAVIQVGNVYVDNDYKGLQILEDIFGEAPNL